MLVTAAPDFAASFESNTYSYMEQAADGFSSLCDSGASSHVVIHIFAGKFILCSEYWQYLHLATRGCNKENNAGSVKNTFTSNRLSILSNTSNTPYRTETTGTQLII